MTPDDDTSIVDGVVSEADDEVLGVRTKRRNNSSVPGGKYQLILVHGRQQLDISRRLSIQDLIRVIKSRFRRGKKKGGISLEGSREKI